MPYADPDKQRAANRASKRRQRAREGRTGLTGVDELLVDLADLPEPPSREELLKVLGAQARAGNVSAIRLLLEEARRDGDENKKPAANPIDELAVRRVAGAS